MERQRAGRAEFYLGPMFSEKTSTVGRKLARARHGGLSCVLVKHAADDRYGRGGVVRTHGGLSIAAAPGGRGLGPLRVVEADALLDVSLRPEELDVGVDEGQFFPDLRQAVDAWVREGRRVYVAALDGDFRREPFPAVAEALPLATRLVKLSAVCMGCAAAGRPAADAHYTLRTVDSEEVLLVGARDKYKAVCLGCYLSGGGAGDGQTTPGRGRTPPPPAYNPRVMGLPPPGEREPALARAVTEGPSAVGGGARAPFQPRSQAGEAASLHAERDPSPVPPETTFQWGVPLISARAGAAEAVGLQAPQPSTLVDVGWRAPPAQGERPPPPPGRRVYAPGGAGLQSAPSSRAGRLLLFSRGVRDPPPARDAAGVLSPAGGSAAGSEASRPSTPPTPRLALSPGP